MRARCCPYVPQRCPSLFVCYCAAKKPTLYYPDMHPVSLIGDVWVPRQRCTCSYRTLNRERNKRRSHVRKQTWCRTWVDLYCSHTGRQSRRLTCAAPSKIWFKHAPPSSLPRHGQRWVAWHPGGTRFAITCPTTDCCAENRPDG